MQETRVQSLGWEDSLEKGMATHPSIFAWKIQWPEEPGGLQSSGSSWTSSLGTVYYFYDMSFVASFTSGLSSQ